MISVLGSLDQWTQADLSSLQTVVCGAAPVPEFAAEAVLARGIPRFVHAYGSSECLTPVCAHASCRVDAPNKTILSTFFGDYEHKLTAEGELLLRGTAAMRGYFPGVRANSPSDWFATGDLFTESEDGLRFVGRIDAQIKVNGFSVSPEVTEKVICDAPGVVSCAVVKATRRSGGEQLVAFVTGTANQAAVVEACQAKLDASQIPRRIIQVERIATNNMGKLDRTKAAAMLEQIGEFNA